MANIQGITSDITNIKLRMAIEKVTNTIAIKHPKDWARIQSRVQMFSQVGIDPSLIGIFDTDDFSINRFDKSGPIRFNVKLLENYSYNSIVAIVAHEIGHAATTVEDFYDRDGYDAEWASELCANYYAAKWGYGLELKMMIREIPLDRFHICGIPGGVYEIESEFGDIVLRVTDDYRLEAVDNAS